MGYTLWAKLSPINIVELASLSPKVYFQDSQPLGLEGQHPQHCQF